ncbi:MAG: ATP-binding protein [Ilumatobacteraceae bacterium]
MGEQRPENVVLDRQYDGTTATLRSARSDMVGCLSDSGIGDDLRDRAELVLSELASNAVQAAPGSPYTLRLSLDHGDVVLRVTSHTVNGGPPSRENWGPSSLLAPTGRGLMIVDELADEVEVDRQAGGTIVVTAVLH